MDSEMNQFSYDSKRLKEIGSLTGFNRDPNSSLYFALRDQEVNQAEIRSIPNSRGGDMGGRNPESRYEGNFYNQPEIEPSKFYFYNYGLV